MQKEMKILSFVLLGLLAFAFLASVVSAANIATDMLSNAANSVSTGISNLVADEPVFIKSLFFLLVLVIVGSLVPIIPLFRGKKFMSFIISIIISILAVWFIPKALIQTMLNPYTAMGIAMISIIPFIMMVLFTQYMLPNTFLKMTAWFFFACLLAIMMVYTALNPWNGVQSTWQSWAYGLVSVLAVLMSFWGRKIEKAIWKGKMDYIYEQAEQKIGEESQTAELARRRREAETIGLLPPNSRRK